MSSKCIRDTVNKVKAKYQESDPYRLAAAMHIIVKKLPLGTDPNCCKGFCMRECRKTCIVINCDLPEIIQQIILIHEIGHALLHQKTPFRSSVFIILNYSMECHNVNMKRIALPLIIFWKMKMSWRCLTLICPFSRLPQN